MKLVHVSLFSGIAGFDLAAKWAGIETVLQCDIDPYCLRVLSRHWPEVRRIPDVRNVTAEAVRAVVPAGSRIILTGGFPCQPFSQAGKKRGKEDDRHLWPEMLRVIQEVRPAWVIGENVAGFVQMALDDCISDLENIGYAVWPLVIPACSCNAPHRRDRVWVLARPSIERVSRRQGRPQYRGGRQTSLFVADAIINSDSAEVGGSPEATAEVSGEHRTDDDAAGQSSGASGLRSGGSGDDAEGKGRPVGDSEHDGRSAAATAGVGSPTVHDQPAGTDNRDCQSPGASRDGQEADSGGRGGGEVLADPEAERRAGVVQGEERLGVGSTSQVDADLAGAGLPRQDTAGSLCAGGCPSEPRCGEPRAGGSEHSGRGEGEEGRTVEPGLGEQDDGLSRWLAQSAVTDEEVRCLRGILRGSARQAHHLFSSVSAPSSVQDKPEMEEANGLPSWLRGPERCWGVGWEAGIPRVATDIPERVSRLKALGNAIVPQVAYEIFRGIAAIEKGRVTEADIDADGVVSIPNDDWRKDV